MSTNAIPDITVANPAAVPAKTTVSGRTIQHFPAAPVALPDVDVVNPAAVPGTTSITGRTKTDA